MYFFESLKFSIIKCFRICLYLYFLLNIVLFCIGGYRCYTKYEYNHNISLFESILISGITYILMFNLYIYSRNEMNKYRFLFV